ncbi:hypothetical protein J7376_03760 [Paracoccus sp. R12_1]|uniref:hypothetical protein n=1 Tax=unclassified Paracoccus (in: a-proteobacteria) TaxID=2688777 RepID=UPI001AD9954A|nr:MULTISPECIES: hypothetical protein [unclassified Paracoccus (in: a-proteobacteria)]MBO9454028.1 hypothetical protein [Paracoccus sp. R12_2]MBO9485625.1 hypothetical protein [Paracoccus sp. R12_1]
MKPVLVLILMMAAGPALSASGTDPTWPCIQRKQPHLSLGQMWAGPVPDAQTAELAQDPQIAALADRLEQRRLPLEEADKIIAEFAGDADNARLTALMQAIFDRIEPDRSALIDGIARYGRRQVDLSKMIEDRRAEMARMEQSEDPDFDAIDAEEEALDWDQRIFTERQQSLTYVCETPVILEQRAFALARSIASHLE